MNWKSEGRFFTRYARTGKSTFFYILFLIDDITRTSPFVFKKRTAESYYPQHHFLQITGGLDLCIAVDQKA